MPERWGPLGPARPAHLGLEAKRDLPREARRGRSRNFISAKHRRLHACQEQQAQRGDSGGAHRGHEGDPPEVRDSDFVVTNKKLHQLWDLGGCR